MTPELIALIITVRPTEAATLPGHLGRAVYAQALRWIDNDLPQLAAVIHDSQGVKPLTCSSLMGAKREGKNSRVVHPGESYTIRLTSFSPDLSHVMYSWLAKPPPAVDLDSVQFEITGITADANIDARAGMTTFEALAAPYLLAKAHAESRTNLRFVTPTVFKSKGMFVPIALPDLVFGSLTNRWNAYSSVGVHPQTREFCEQKVALSRYDLRSRSLPGKSGGARSGCVGTASYVALSSDGYWRGILQILTDFAFYSGVGSGTTNGMGQAKRLVLKAQQEAEK